MQKIHKELHVIQLHHRWNKNIPIHKTFTEEDPYTCGDCNLVISLQKNPKSFLSALLNLHNVSNASCCFLSFIYLKMYKISYH